MVKENHIYAALDKHDNAFHVVYSKNMGDVKVSHDFLNLADYIAYYFHRYYAKLVEIKKNSYADVSMKIQNKFQKRLDSEFFFHEMK